ncbi:MAG: toll/interleukin-1 receptor domain-containing protein, partial [Vicinamibacterales bacterium]
MPGSSDRPKPARDQHSPRVFVSYRRGDSAGQTGRLVHDLQTRFGAHTFFRDIDDLEPGVDFPEALTRALSECEAMLVMIGPTWASISDTRGRRLDQPDDFVRLEVAAGLSRDGLVVIPVLVGGSVLPGPGELPEALQSLHRRNAVEISDTRWEYDTHRLGDALIKQLHLKEKAPAPTDGGTAALTPRTLLVLALPTVLLALFAVAAMFWRVPTAVTVDVTTPRASFV